MSSTDFALHPQLVQDCHVLGRCAGHHLLLHRHAAVPWFLLVPETSAVELFELDPLQRASLNATADRLALFTKAHFACEKINIAALGNVVSQLHLHVIGRRRDDCCWPRPVWGNLTGDLDYLPAALVDLADALRRARCLD